MGDRKKYAENYPTPYEYRREERELAFQFAPKIYPCRSCGWPVADGYVCQYCGDDDPNGEAVERPKTPSPLNTKMEG